MKKYIGTKQIEAEPMMLGDWVAKTNTNPYGKGSKEHYETEPGYYVRYKDGNVSWSPKDLFEKTYFEKVGNGLPFGIALEEVKRGKGMRLPSWKSDVVIRLWKPGRIKQLYDKLSIKLPNSYVDDALEAVDLLNLDEMTAPFLYVSSRFGMVPWKETMIELLSNEWEVVD